jgi:hypothetical protein
MSEQTPNRTDGEALSTPEQPPGTAETAAEAPGAEQSAAELPKDAGKDSKKAAPPAAEKDRTIWFWVLGIVIALSVELYIYGRNGFVQVCVGVEGVTDYAQRNMPRSAVNAKTAPHCASRLNLGMYSDTDERAREALNEACSRATILNRKELTPCLRRENKWTRQVYKEQVPPWDKRLYRRLLWLD